MQMLKINKNRSWSSFLTNTCPERILNTGTKETRDEGIGCNYDFRALLRCSF